jgi:hypothetical protein
MIDQDVSNLLKPLRILVQLAEARYQTPYGCDLQVQAGITGRQLLYIPLSTRSFRPVVHTRPLRTTLRDFRIILRAREEHEPLKSGSSKVLLAELCQMTIVTGHLIIAWYDRFYKIWQLPARDTSRWRQAKAYSLNYQPMSKAVMNAMQ